jgi:hypothetical protein
MCRYNNTLLNASPEMAATMPFISRSKSVARTAEEFKPECSTGVVQVLGFLGAREFVDLFFEGV